MVSDVGPWTDRVCAWIPTNRSLPLWFSWAFWIQCRPVSCSRVDPVRSVHVNPLSFFVFLPPGLEDVSSLFESLDVFQIVCSTQWSKNFGKSWSNFLHIVRKHFSALILIIVKCHLGEASRESSPCVRRQHRWRDIVWSSDRSSEVCWMWLIGPHRYVECGLTWVWTGRSVSVVKLDGESSLWLSPSVRNQSPVKVDVVTPLLCSKNVRPPWYVPVFSMYDIPIVSEGQTVHP